MKEIYYSPSLINLTLKGHNGLEWICRSVIRIVIALPWTLHGWVKRAGVNSIKKTWLKSKWIFAIRWFEMTYSASNSKYRARDKIIQNWKTRTEFKLRKKTLLVKQRAHLWIGLSPVQLMHHRLFLSCSFPVNLKNRKIEKKIKINGSFNDFTPALYKFLQKPLCLANTWLTFKTLLKLHFFSHRNFLPSTDSLIFSRVFKQADVLSVIWETGTSTLSVTGSVSQGSVLGLLLLAIHTLHTNDLDESVGSPEVVQQDVAWIGVC